MTKGAHDDSNTSQLTWDQRNGSPGNDWEANAMRRSASRSTSAVRSPVTSPYFEAANSSTRAVALGGGSSAVLAGPSRHLGTVARRSSTADGALVAVWGAGDGLGRWLQRCRRRVPEKGVAAPR